jgi:hypothetical protein
MGASGAKSAPISSSSRRASRRIVFQSTVCRRLRGERPANTFSATVRSSNTVGSWYMATIPSACAARGPPIERGSPSTSTAPASGETTPVRIFTSVDLPAPFSPTSACVLAGAIANETSSTACTPPYAFETPRSSTSGVAAFIACTPP